MKKCFAIAGQNLKQIVDITPDPARKSELTTKLLKTVNFAEELNKKILGDPTKYDAQQQFYQNYNEQEKAIIKAGTLLKENNFELWSPASGFTNIYSNKLYVDPQGMLSLSEKQMKKLAKWYRAVDILDKKFFINGYPDVATHITGYEIM